MPSSPCFSIRKNLRMTETSSNRMVVLLAMRDITHRRLPPLLWSHPAVATMLGVSPELLALVQAYLEHRRHPGPWKPYEVQFIASDSFHARVWDTVFSRPAHYVALPVQGDEVRLAHVLRLGTQESFRVAKPLLLKAERIVGQACGATWSNLEEALVSQGTAMKQGAVA